MRKAVFTALLLLGLDAPAATPQTSRSMFVYQNNFWLNLHEFLRGEIYRRGANLTPGVDPASLPEAERKAWASAIEVYTEVAKHDQVFDDGAQQISNALRQPAPQHACVTDCSTRQRPRRSMRPHRFIAPDSGPDGNRITMPGMQRQRH